MLFNRKDIVKTVYGDIVEIINTPKSFMSNGSYEVIKFSFSVGTIGKPFWVKQEEILYPIDIGLVDDFNNYFEIIYAQDGLNLIPKGLSNIKITSTDENFKKITFNYGDNQKYNELTIHVGDVEVVDEDISKKIIKPKESKLKRIINILKNTKDEI